jgi:hypothetical protein
MDGLAVPLVFAVDFNGVLCWRRCLRGIPSREFVASHRSVAFCLRSSVSQHFVDLELWIKLQPEPGKRDVPRGRSPSSLVPSGTMVKPTDLMGQLPWMWRDVDPAVFCSCFLVEKTGVLGSDPYHTHTHLWPFCAKTRVKFTNISGPFGSQGLLKLSFGHHFDHQLVNLPNLQSLVLGSGQIWANLGTWCR